MTRIWFDVFLISTLEAGYRIEHPQKVINKIQYGAEWGAKAYTGKLSTDNINEEYFSSMKDDSNGDVQNIHYRGSLPVPSYRLATDKAFDGESVSAIPHYIYKQSISILLHSFFVLRLEECILFVCVLAVSG